MHRDPLPPHLPKPASDPVAYQQLHDFSWWLRTGGEVREEARRPVAPSTHSASSSLVATRNRPATARDHADFRVCDATGDSDAWREIRIPTGLSAAEVYRKLPSATDFEYGDYLTKTRIRYVTGDWIWVWTKNQQTLKMAWRLWKWELQNLAPTLMASCRSHGKHMVSHYVGQALQELGLRWPCRQLLDPKRWTPLLRETLGIRTRLLRR